MTSEHVRDPARAAPSLDRPSTPVLWLTLVVVLIADGLDLIDATITNVAAPTVVGELGGGAGMVKWLGAAYALALGSFLVVGGRLGDKFGQRRIFLIGMTGFVAASAAAGLATGPAMMIVSRLAQGGFGALMIPQGMAIMTKTFPREALRRAFGAFGPMLGLFAVGGPVLAGFLIDANLFGLGWRPIFLINIVLGGAGLALAVRYLPRVDADRFLRIDLLSSGLLTLAMFALLYGLAEGPSDGWTVVPIASVAAAAVLLTLFARRQFTTPEPLLSPRLLADRGFTAGLLCGLMIFAAFSGLTYVVALFFQLGLHFTPSRASLSLLPLTIGIIIAAGAGMALIAKLGRRMVLGGLTLTILGAGGLLLLAGTRGLAVTWWQLAAVTLVIGMGAGACFGSIFDTALGDIAPDEAGAASGSLSAVQQLAAGIGSAAVSSVYLATVDSGQIAALVTSLTVVLALCGACLLTVPLLPRKAAAREH
jgi:EmrB/QacA subfamily drug resistance transporter